MHPIWIIPWTILGLISLILGCVSLYVAIQMAKDHFHYWRHSPYIDWDNENSPKESY